MCVRIPIRISPAYFSMLTFVYTNLYGFELRKIVYFGVFGIVIVYMHHANVFIYTKYMNLYRQRLIYSLFLISVDENPFSKLWMITWVQNVS